MGDSDKIMICLLFFGLHNDIYITKYTQKFIKKHVQTRCFGPYAKQEDYFCEANQVSNDVNAFSLPSNPSIYIWTSAKSCPEMAFSVTDSRNCYNRQ